MVIQRELSKKLIQLAKQFRVIALVGPHQSGKSILAKIIFPQHAYVSLENLDNRARALEDAPRFLASYDNDYGVIIDEAQHVPSLFSYIQTRVDEVRRPGYYILTGSHNFLLNEGISQSLAGRVAYLTLLPLSINELKKAHSYLKMLRVCFMKGAFLRCKHLIFLLMIGIQTTLELILNEMFAQ